MLHHHVLRAFPRSALALPLLLLAACPGPLDQDRVPTTIRLSSSAVTLDDGSSVQLTATVHDQNDQPFETLPAGLAVEWSSSDASIGSVSGGLVSGNRPGEARITATAGQASATVQVSVNAVPTGLAGAGGDDQNGTAGAALPQAIAVRVTDRHGDGVSGVVVTFAVTGGGGSVSPATVSTDASGIAQASWTLGAAGQQDAEARAAAVAGAVVAFRANVRNPTDPVITGISPAVLTPGASATIQGSNLSIAGLATTVSIAGVAAAVTAATPTSVTVQLPTGGFACEATRPVAVQVAVAGTRASREHPLQVATQRSLGVGESLILANATEVACNELAQTGGRYFISVYNTSTTLSATAAFELRGRAATALAEPPLPAVQAAAVPGTARAGAERPTGSTPTSSPGQLEQRRQREAERAHHRILEENLRILRETPSPLPALRARQAERTRQVTPAAASSIGNLGAITQLRYSFGGGCTSFTPIGVRTAWVGQRAIIVEDTASFHNGQPTLKGTLDSYYAQLGTEFDSVMWPIVLEHFGNPLAMDALLGNHGKIIMVFSPQVNTSQAQAFVYSCDLFPQSQAPRSNEAAVFYARVPTQAGSGFSGDTPDNWMRITRSTTIHEVKHIASIAERAFRSASTWEESWLEEGTARYAEELYGRRIYGTTQRANSTYAQTAHCDVRPGVPACLGRPYVIFKHFAAIYDYLSANETLTPLGAPGSIGSDWSFYGSAWSLIRWAVDHHASSEAVFTRALTQDGSRAGVANLQARVGRPFTELLGEWSLALALDDRPGFTPRDARLTMPSWHYTDIFNGMRADFPTSYGAPALVPRGVSFGDFLVPVGALRAGTFSMFELSGTQAARQLIELRGTAGGAPANTLRIAIARVS